MGALTQVISVALRRMDRAGSYTSYSLTACLEGKFRIIE